MKINPSLHSAIMPNPTRTEATRSADRPDLQLGRPDILDAGFRAVHEFASRIQDVITQAKEIDRDLGEAQTALRDYRHALEKGEDARPALERLPHVESRRLSADLRLLGGKRRQVDVPEISHHRLGLDPDHSAALQEAERAMGAVTAVRQEVGAFRMALADEGRQQISRGGGKPIADTDQARDLVRFTRIELLRNQGLAILAQAPSQDRSISA